MDRDRYLLSGQGEQMVLGKLAGYMQKTEFSPPLCNTMHKNVKLKWINDLVIRPEPVTYIKEKICRNLHDIKYRGIFNNLMSLAKQK